MLILLFLLIGVLGLALYTLALKNLFEKKSDWWMIPLLLALAMVSSGYMIEGMLCERSQPTAIHVTEFKVKTEVRLKITNGKETSRDTVYIFTPKKH